MEKIKEIEEIEKEINIEEIKKNIYTIKNRLITITDNNKKKDIIFRINTKEYYNLIINYGINNIFSKEELKEIYDINNKYKTRLYYDYNEIKIDNNKKYIINTSNITNIIINSIIYYLRKNSEEGIINKFKNIIKQNINKIEFYKDKNEEKQIKIYFNSLMFNEINNMKLNINIILNNKNLNYEIKNIEINEYMRIYYDDKYINYIVGKINEDYEYKYNIILKNGVLLLSKDLEEFNDEIIKISMINNNLENKITKQEHNNLHSYKILSKYLQKIKNEYNIKIDNIEFINKKINIYMKNELNEYITYKNKEFLTKYKLLFFNISEGKNIQENNIIINLSKNKNYGLICNNYNININIQSKTLKSIQFYIIELDDCEKFNPNLSNYNYKIIGGFKINLYKIELLPFNEIIDNFINLLKINY